MWARARGASMQAMTTPALTEEVVPGLHRIDLGRVNAYLLDTGEGPVLIDSGFPGDEPRILGALAELALPPRALRQIVLTHAHPDHVGGAALLRAATGAPIAMHPLDAELVARGATGRPMEPAPGFAGRVPERLLAPFPITPFTPDAELLPGGGAPRLPGITVLSAPGHSAGQVVLRWNRHGGVLIGADAATSLEGLALARVCEDPDAAIRTFGRLHRLAVETAVFGHGTPLAGGAGAALKRAADDQARAARQASLSLIAEPVRSTPPA
jgi:glyoxylase-like metal-dependent hydrolase (beta-lactamase superfamily II)